MAITRTPIQDDSGSGQDGTVIDNSWKTELYNQIDGAVAGGTGIILAPYKIPSELLFDCGAIGSFNNFQPPAGTTKVVWYISASVPTTITGIVGEAIGTLHLLYATATAGPITLANDSGSSLSANRMLCPNYTNLTINGFASVWIYYSSVYGKWVALKP